MRGRYKFKQGATAALLALALTMSGHADERAGMYLGASSAKELGCIFGPPDPVRGLTFGCTFFDLQKHGSMGRQIATSPLVLPAVTLDIINITWTNQDNNSASGGRNVRYDSYDPSTGALSDGSGGVDIGGDLIPPNRSGFTVLTGSSDGTVINAHDWNRNPEPVTLKFKTNVFRNQTEGVADFVGGEVDTATDTILCGLVPCPRPNYIWPQLAFTEPSTGPEVRHLVRSLDEAPFDFAMYSRSVADSGWQSIAAIENLGYFRSPVIAASRQSRRVAIAWSGGRGNGTEFGASVSRFNDTISGKNDNDVYVMISEDAGITWSAIRNVTRRTSADPGGWAAHAKFSILFDEADSLHVVWQALEWVGYNAEFNTRSRMFHWGENTNTVRTAVEANWDPNLCNGGENTLNLDNPQLSACNGKLYLSYTQFAPVPLGKGDDCSNRAQSGDSLGAANGDIYVSVSSDRGFTWDTPRNLTDTYTPNCDTLPGSPLQDCDSDVWHSVTRYGIDVSQGDFLGLTDLTENLDPTHTGMDQLFTIYINDGDPGAAIRGEGGWTFNAVKAIRFGCVEPIPSALLASSLPEASVFEIPEIFPPSADTTFNWILENIGSGVITDLELTLLNQNPGGAFSVVGFPTTLSTGTANTDTAHITLNISSLPEGSGSIDFSVDGSFVGAPKTFSLTYTLTIPVCCESAGDPNNDGKMGIADVSFLIARIFAGGPAPECCEAADANGNGFVNIADITYMIARIFAGGPPPVCGPAGIGC